LFEGLRTEWAKSRARVHRWDEEVELTLEEMHHVICYMDWHAWYWRLLISKCQVLDAALQEGMAAYAEKQAHIAEAMAHKCSQEWFPLLEGFSIIPDWPEHHTSNGATLDDVMME
jgi:hypothetical protein